MRGAAFFLTVLGVSYLVLAGLEYSKHIQTQNWTAAKGTVVQAINSIPITKYDPNRLNVICTLVNWTYVKYSFSIGAGHYDGEQELGPHLTIFDYMVGPIAVRLPKGKEIDVRYNPRNPNESRLTLDALHPVEMFFGTASVYLVAALLLFYINKISATAEGDDDELNQPLEYFEKKRRSLN
jgi:hypothetical protein